MKTIPLIHEGETVVQINANHTEVYICSRNPILCHVLDLYCTRSYSYFKNIKHGEIDINNSETLIKDYIITLEEIEFRELWEMLGKHV